MKSEKCIVRKRKICIRRQAEKPPDPHGCFAAGHATAGPVSLDSLPFPIIFYRFIARPFALSRGWAMLQRRKTETLRRREIVMTILEANEKLSADLQAVMRDAEALMKATDGMPGTQASELRNRLANALDNA